MTQPNIQSITYRLMQSADGPAVADLYIKSSDSGRLAITPKYILNPFHAMTADEEDAVGVVAQTAEGNIIGAGFVKITTRYVDHQPRPIAFLHSLAVHPDYRQQGIATKLASQRIHYARQKHSNILILTNIQAGNVGSIKVAETWGATPIGSLTVRTLRTHQKKSSSGFQILRLKTPQIPTFYQSLTQYQANSNFLPVTDRPHQSKTTDYFVVVRQDGMWVAGTKLVHTYQVRQMFVEKVPWLLSMINFVTKQIPSDRLLKPAAMTEIWCAPEHESALQSLVEYLQGHLHNVADLIMLTHDSQSSITNMISTPRWLPSSTLTVYSSQQTNPSLHITPL